MSVIVPTVTAFEPHEYREQIERLEVFASRVHIDLMDGVFAPSVSPGLEQIWWPESMTADIHLMYQHPMEQIENLIRLKPNLVIIHAEAEVSHADFATRMHAAGIKAGLALLADSSVKDSASILKNYDHVLVFSGHLGFHGGKADLAHLSKVNELRQQFSTIEISWDGGINDENAAELAKAGVEVLNVGGYIQKAPDPGVAYAKLKSLIEG